MFSLVLAFSGALAFQTPPDVSTLPPEQAAQVSKVFAGMTRMFETLGTCESQFPPGVADQIRASMAAETDPAKKAATAFLLDAYDKGKASPPSHPTNALRKCRPSPPRCRRSRPKSKPPRPKTEGSETRNVYHLRDDGPV